MMDDDRLRKAILAGVVLVVGACVLSQVMMQMGGGARDEPMDLSDQVPEGGGIVVLFPDGLPPFISSGGVYQPEKAVFDIGLGLGGLLMIALSFEVFHRTEPEGRGRRLANVGALVSGIVVGFSMFNLTANPLHTDLLAHIFWAMNIFWGAQIWMGCLTHARGGLDAHLRWRGWSLNRVRWSIFAFGVISFQAMTAFIATGHLVESAIFEWTLTFSAEAMMLTLIPAICPVSE